MHAAVGAKQVPAVWAPQRLFLPVRHRRFKGRPSGAVDEVELPRRVSLHGSIAAPSRVADQTDARPVVEPLQNRPHFRGAGCPNVSSSAKQAASVLADETSRPSRIGARVYRVRDAEQANRVVP